MIRSSLLAHVLSISILATGLGCGPSSAAAPDGEAHPHEPTSVTVFGERLLLFMEYPHLVRGEPARFLAHLTVLATGEPVRSGSVVLEIGATRLAVDGPTRDGLFIPEDRPSAAGTFPGRLTVTSEQAQEVLELGEIVVHADAAGADRAVHAAEGRQPSDAIAFLLEPQWKLRLLLARAERRTLSVRLNLPAQAVAPEGLAAVVSPSIGGRLLAPPAGELPRSGDRVEAGQVLGLVEPLLGAPELAQLQALDLEFDLRALDVLRASGEAQARLRFAERERERIATLRAEGLSTQQQLEQAEQNLSLARTQLEAAGNTSASLERLVERRVAAGGERSRGATRFALEAPIAGVVTEVLGLPGLGVEAGQPLFRILDPARIWVDGRISEFDLAHIDDSSRARAQFAALPGRAFELRGPRGAGPFLGAEVDALSRTLLVRYELDNSDGAVRPGMLAELQVATGEHEAAVVIPFAAVVTDQGLPTAYVMLSGELFQKRELELGTRDGDWVEVLGGVAAGERVATRGAHIVKLAALSPDSFGAGHAH